MGKPVYIKIMEEIKEKIKQGILKSGDMIQSENELAQIYDVSRMTVRKSLSILIHEGYIYTIPGKGNYIGEPNQNKHIIYFDEMNNIDAIVEKTELLEVNVIKPSVEVMLNLQIEKNKKVVIIRRVLHSDEGPVAYDEKYIPYDKGAPIVEKEIHYATFPEIVASKTSLFSIKKELRIGVMKSEKNISKILKIKEGEPLLVIEQKILNDKNKVIGWGKIVMKNECCKLTAFSSYNQEA